MNDKAPVPNPDASGGKQVSVQVDHERLKHFFYLMHGEPGSRTKVLSGAIMVTKSDIERLIGSLIEQLRLAHVRDFTIKIGVGFEKEIVEKNYEDFRAYAWKEPHKTTELMVRINFLYEDYDSGNPLKHAFFLRIARQINPGSILQILASGDNDKLDSLESIMSPVFCRTDHINDELSKALINALTEWHKGQKQPQLVSATYKFAKEHKEAVARVTHYSFAAVSCLVVSLAMFKASSLVSNPANLMPTYFSLLATAVFLNSFFINHGSRKAGSIFNDLKKISEEDVIFEITQGDDKDYSERIAQNKKAFGSARSQFLWVMGQNIAAGVIASGIFKLLE